MKIKYLRSVPIAGLTILLVLIWSLSGSVNIIKANVAIPSPTSPTASFPALQAGPDEARPS